MASLFVVVEGCLRVRCLARETIGALFDERSVPKGYDVGFTCDGCRRPGTAGLVRGIVCIMMEGVEGAELDGDPSMDDIPFVLN